VDGREWVGVGSWLSEWGGGSLIWANGCVNEWLCEWVGGSVCYNVG
jgi:hypothetical protein